MERLWMFAVLTGSVTDFSWPDKDVTYTASDGTTYTEPISVYSEDCEGHRGSDIFPFDLLDTDANDFTVQTGIKGNVPGGGNMLTNREALLAFDPRINALPYVYDTFEWAHCKEDGFDLNDAWAARSGGAEANARAPAGNPDGGGGPEEKGGAQHGGGGGGARDRKTAGGRAIIEKNAARYPRYASLESKMASLKKRNHA